MGGVGPGRQQGSVLPYLGCQAGSTDNLYVRGQTISNKPNASNCGGCLPGAKECAEITHEQTLTIMEIMDECRRQVGVVYEVDK